MIRYLRRETRERAFAMGSFCERKFRSPLSVRWISPSWLRELFLRVLFSRNRGITGPGLSFFFSFLQIPSELIEMRASKWRGFLKKNAVFCSSGFHVDLKYISRIARCLFVVVVPRWYSIKNRSVIIFRSSLQSVNKRKRREGQVDKNYQHNGYVCVCVPRCNRSLAREPLRVNVSFGFLYNKIWSSWKEHYCMKRPIMYLYVRLFLGPHNISFPSAT